MRKIAPIGCVVGGLLNLARYQWGGNHMKMNLIVGIVCIPLGTWMLLKQWKEGTL